MNRNGYMICWHHLGRRPLWAKMLSFRLNSLRQLNIFAEPSRSGRAESTAFRATHPEFRPRPARKSFKKGVEGVMASAGVAATAVIRSLDS